MIVVYVKHYLNEDGRSYFDEKWFPYVRSIITKQEGFLGIDTFRDDQDKGCINITVKFTDSETLDRWVKNDFHQEVINDLDPYRTKGQRWFVSDGSAPPSLNKWEEAPLIVTNH